jgi:hypothetical protein
VNRAEATRQVLLIEAARDQLDARAKVLREGLNADAVAEYEEQGSAQTWRFDIGTWSQGISKDAPVIEDARSWVGWVKKRYPAEVLEVVNPSFQKVVLSRLVSVGEEVLEPTTGEIVPGLGVRPGGRPLSLRFKPNGDALAVADQVGTKLAGQILDGLGIPGGES